MSKILITSLALLISLAGFSQSLSGKASIDQKVTKVENMAVTITVDSAEELKSVFTIKDIKELMEESSKDESISVKIICNKKDQSTGIESQVSYKVEGNSDERKNFLKTVEKIRSAAIKYYDEKK